MQEIYDNLWKEAAESFSRGTVKTDPHLSNLSEDRRLGISLIVRSDDAVIARFEDLTAALKELDPNQHYYQADEFHVTVMTIIPASEDFDSEKVPVGSYQAVFKNVFNGFGKFGIRFRGITASPSSVMIQGFNDDGCLNKIRDAVRAGLGDAGLPFNERYEKKTVAAHSTIMRFRSQPENVGRLFSMLQAERERNRDFGISEINRVDFVINDWYMSRDKVKVVERYGL
jgi:2'-5' RNA ligase